MTIGKEFKGRRVNIESVALMDKQSQTERENTGLFNFHSQNIKRLEALERRVLRNPLFKDFSTLHQKGIDILTWKYHKKEDKINVFNVYYQMIEGTGQYEEVFSDGLIIEGIISGKGAKNVLYLNDGFGKRTYEIEWVDLKKKLFSPKKIELQIPIEDGTKDKPKTRQRVVMKKTNESIDVGYDLWPGLEYYEGEIPQIDKYGGAKITLVKVLDIELINNVESWQEDKDELKKKVTPKEIKESKEDEDYKDVSNNIVNSLNLLVRLQGKMSDGKVAKMIKEAVDLARQRSTIGLPVGHEVTEEAAKKRQKAVTDKKSAAK